MAPDIEPYRSRQRFKLTQTPKNLKNEAERLKTFINWTVSFLDSKKLAKGGFYCTNKEDAVKCAYCQVEIDSWEQGDVPERKHKRLSPNCPLVAGEDDASQTQSEAQEDKNENEEEEIPSQDVCGPYGLEIRPFPVSRTKKPDVAQEQKDNKTESHSSQQKFPDPPRPKNLKDEAERLKTFVNWTVSFLDSKKLAKGGFYYTNENDTVRCVYCGVKIGCWQEGDIPEEEHKNKSPDCPLVKSQSRGSQTEPESVEENEENKEGEVPSQDVCGTFAGMEIRPFSGPERPGKVPFAVETSNLWKNFEDIGVYKIGRPVHPQYATYNARLKTYENWPIPEIQAPEKLAEAGFFFKSARDQVMCFHCGGGLHNWEVDDDPWFDHARWFSKCAFVILQKGREFINEVHAKEIQACSPNLEVSEKKKEVIQKTQAAEKSLTPPISIKPPVSTSTSTPDKETQLSQSPKSDTKGLELCRVCYMKEREIVFLPCGHFISCTQCALSLSKCAVCRKPYEATVRAYLS